MTDYLKRMTDRYPALESVRGQVSETFEILRTSYENGGKLLVCGNGGSASDSEHIVGELMKGFYRQRSLSFQSQNLQILRTYLLRIRTP